MKSFLTNTDNDLLLDDLGNISVGSGLDAYTQVLRNAILLQQYEYPYNLNNGVNYLGYILGKAPNVQAWEEQLLNIVEGMPFVEKIINWQYNIENNNFLFTLTVKTDLGNITIEG